MIHKRLEEKRDRRRKVKKEWEQSDQIGRNRQRDKSVKSPKPMKSAEIKIYIIYHIKMYKLLEINISTL